MEDIYEALLFFDELAPRKQEAVAKRLNSDPALADAFSHWRAACARIRKRFAADLPDCRLLVLYALDADGHGDLLTAHEQSVLEDARPELEAALDTHPALHDVVAHIQAERDAFDALWHEQAGVLSEAAAPEATDAIDGVATADASEASSTSTDRADRGPNRSEARATRSASGRRIGWLATTALAVVATVLAVFLWPRSAPQTVITTGPGEMERLELVDGSMVRLGENSELAYDASTGEPFDRLVTLRYGRAFFEVQELKSEAPFRVETPTATATVLGTAFGVDASPERTDVVLSSGSVAVNTPDGASTTAVTLRPGQRSRVVQGATPSPPETVDLADALSWTGLLVFRGSSAQQIANRLATEYDVSITVDPALQDEAVTGTFDRSQPVTTILEAVAATLDARVTGSPDDELRLVAP